MRNKKYCGLSLAIAAAILYLSIIPEIPGEDILRFPHADKTAHFLAYAALAVLINRAANNKHAAFLIAGTYGLIIEIIQFYLPHRAFEWPDIIVNYLGAVLVYRAGASVRGPLRGVKSD